MHLCGVPQVARLRLKFVYLYVNRLTTPLGVLTVLFDNDSSVLNSFTNSMQWSYGIRQLTEKYFVFNTATIFHLMCIECRSRTSKMNSLCTLIMLSLVWWYAYHLFIDKLYTEPLLTNGKLNPEYNLFHVLVGMSSSDSNMMGQLIGFFSKKICTSWRLIHWTSFCLCQIRSWSGDGIMLFSLHYTPSYNVNKKACHIKVWLSFTW